MTRLDTLLPEDRARVDQLGETQAILTEALAHMVTRALQRSRGYTPPAVRPDLILLKRLEAAGLARITVAASGVTLTMLGYTATDTFPRGALAEWAAAVLGRAEVHA